MGTEIQSSHFTSMIGFEALSRRRYVDYYEHEVELIAKERRRGRKSAADCFREEYHYGRCDDKKTCIWRGGCHSWSVKSSGITWVGVHGNDSICVVTKAGDLDVTRVHGFLLFAVVEAVDCNFRRCVISEMEDLADPNTKPQEMRDKSVNKPFSVVSVVPVTNKVHDASSDSYVESKVVQYRLEYVDKKIRGEEDSSEDDSEIDYDDEDEVIKRILKRERRQEREEGIPYTDYDEDTIKFLQDKLKRDTAANPSKETVQADECDEKGAIAFLEDKMKKSAEHFTLDETIKTAISAFQRLFNKNFEAKDIEVCVMDPNYWVSLEEEDYKDIYVNHLETDEIENYLSDMSEPESKGSCSSPSTSDVSSPSTSDVSSPSTSEGSSPSTSDVSSSFTSDGSG